MLKPCGGTNYYDNEFQPHCSCGRTDAHCVACGGSFETDGPVHFAGCGNLIDGEAHRLSQEVYK